MSYITSPLWDVTSPLHGEFGVTTPIYQEYYSRSNSSYSPFTTVFPDISDWSFEDSEIQSEDSDVSSVFDEDNLATKVKILETKLDLISLQRNREKEEMLRLHQAMVKLVTDLIDVVSLPTSPLPDSSSLLKPEPSVQPSPHHSTGKEPLHVATQEVHSHTCQFEDTVRKQQQLQIDKMVAYIDERAA